MDKGTYAAASAGLAAFRKMDVVSNNLANINTAGFKRQFLVTESQPFDTTLAKEFEKNDPFARGDHAQVHGVVDTYTATDFGQGGIRATGNPLDVALRNPNDFFVINAPQGVRYTRAGDFTLNSEGNLVTQDGLEVQGDGGAINATGAGTTINPDGSVTSGGQNIGRLQVVRFDNPKDLERAEGTRFSLPSGKTPPQSVDADLVTGSVEASNVSVVSGMLEMITANRGFETYTRVAQTIDQLNTQSITQIGRGR